MVTAIRLSLFERGLDPTDFSLVSFGGAGGLHAATIAEELGIGRVVFPMNASTLSASGVLWSDIAHDLATTKMRIPGASAIAELNDAMDLMARDGAALLETDGIVPAQRRYDFALDIRYRGQGFELTIPVFGSRLDAASLENALEQFHSLHQQLFSHSDSDEDVELITLRLTARGLLDKPQVAPFAPGEAGAPTSRRIFLAGSWQELPVHPREGLRKGYPLQGPILIQERFTSLLVPAGWRIEAELTGNLIAIRDA